VEFHGGRVIEPPVTAGSATVLLASRGYEAPLRGWLGGHGTLMAAAEAHGEGVRLQGRGPVVVVPRPDRPGREGERWVVRHYHRGGAVARALSDRYLRVGTPRPFIELRLLAAMHERGVPAPEPVGAAVYTAGAFYRGDLVTVWVPDSTDLATILFGPLAGAGGWTPNGAGHDPRLAAMSEAGRLVRRLHDRGVEHRDLNLKNVLLDRSQAGPRALILDLDRARLHEGKVPERARRAMVSRFWRSARKWERRTGVTLPPAFRSAFGAGYAAGSA
jgi:3-deoxy-D-manno-octulosonic acid kinase